MPYNFSIAEDNIFKKQLHNLKDASNPTLFSYISLGERHAPLSRSGVALRLTENVYYFPGFAYALTK